VREASDKQDGISRTKFFTYFNNGETVIVKERAFPQDFPEIKDSAVYTYQNIKIPCLAD